jgi:hypothetical protein
VETNTCADCSPISALTIQNIPESVQITEVENLIAVSRPDLNRTQFELYGDNVLVGVFSGVQGQVAVTGEINTPERQLLPQAFLATNETLNQAPVTESFNFEISASPTLSGEEIIDLFEVPTYPGPVEDLAPFMTYAVPALVIPYDGSLNNYVLTPVIDKIYPGLTILLNQSSFVESNVAAIRQVQMIFDVEAAGAGLSFGISNAAPPDIPQPPLDVPALFLDVGFVGNIDFSEPSVFRSSPIVDVIVNKTIDGFSQLEDGCADFRVLLFNEQTEEWETVEQLRNPKFDSESQCGFTLHPEHFSKFAVGGVKGQSVTTEDPPDEHEDKSDGNRGRGGGGSRSTAISQPPSGADISTIIRTQSGIVSVTFENINQNSGQLKINSYELSNFEELFNEVVFLQDNDEHGIIRLHEAIYSTAGAVYDIDGSHVSFRGAVDVTIPFDERIVMTFGSESDVIFLHFDKENGMWEDRTKEVDTEANTVTGTLDSLSPVTSAIIIGETRGSEPTLPPALGISTPLFSTSRGGHLTLAGELMNEQLHNQDYVMIVQLVDNLGIVQHLDWRVGSVASNQGLPFHMSWNEIEEGTYTAEIFLLTDLENPWLLSDTVRTEVQI